MFERTLKESLHNTFQIEKLQPEPMTIYFPSIFKNFALQRYRAHTDISFFPVICSVRLSSWS
jgi:hypothetical protein